MARAVPSRHAFFTQAPQISPKYPEPRPITPAGERAPNSSSRTLKKNKVQNARKDLAKIRQVQAHEASSGAHTSFGLNPPKGEVRELDCTSLLQLSLAGVNLHLDLRSLRHVDQQGIEETPFSQLTNLNSSKRKFDVMHISPLVSHVTTPYTLSSLTSGFEKRPGGPLRI